MARTPYEGAPTVQADLEAPNDYQRVDATPASFGAQVGEGLEDAGQSALKLSGFYGQVAADDATNNYIQSATKVLRGDPNAPPATDADGAPILGPGGAPVNSGGYFSLRGADAMSARADTAAQLEELRQEQLSSLATPEAKHQFDTESRRYSAQYANEMGEHYDQQFQQWAVNTSKNGIALTQSAVASHLNNPDALAQDRETLRNFYVKQDQAQYGRTDPAVTQGAVLKADQDFYLTQIRAAGDNGLRAKQALDESGTTLASLPNYDGIVRQVNTAVFNQEKTPFIQSHIAADMADAARLVHSAPSATMTTGTPTSAVSTVSAAIGQQEWNGKGPAPTSIDGAIGPSQIKPDTALQYGLDPARLDDPPYAKFARDTIVSKLSALPQVQGDPARIAVGYFSGPGNIAPQGSATPYLHDYADGNGKTVSSYVADVTGRAQQNNQPQAGQYPTVADAINATITSRVDAFRAQAQAKWGDEHPEWVESATNDYERQLNRVVDQQKRQYEVNTHTVQSVMAGANAPISEEQLRARGPQVSAAWDALQFENPYVRTSVENRFNAESKGKALTYGTGFKDYLDRALAPQSDPNRIADPMALNNYVGPGEDAALTNTGQNQLADLMAQRGTPQGEAFAAQTRTFMDQLHAELTFSNQSAGQYDRQGEALYAKASAQILPKLIDAYKGGTLAQVLDPKNPDYLGNIATAMARTPTQIMKDRLYPKDSPAALTLQTSSPNDQGIFLLKEAVGQGHLSARQAALIALEHGWKPSSASVSPGAKSGAPHAPPGVQVPPALTPGIAGLQ